MLFRQLGKTVTHVVESPSFVQDRNRRHRIHGFPENMSRENFRQADLNYFREPEGDILGVSRSRAFLINTANTIERHGHAFIPSSCDLAAPARVTPAPATEQQQH